MTEARAIRGPYRSGIARRRQIVRAAAEVFAAEGYRGGSLRQIAQEVGVTPAALNRHFERKEDLLTAVLEYWRDETALLIDDTAEGIDYFTGMRNLVAYHVGHRGYLELFLALSTEAVNPDHPAADFIRRRYDGTVATFSGHLAHAVDRGDVRTMDAAEIDRESRALIAYLDGIELQWLLDPTLDLLAHFDHHLHGMLESWGYRPASPR